MSQAAVLKGTLIGRFSRATRWMSHSDFWILMKQDMTGWQWHQLDRMRINCSLYFDNFCTAVRTITANAVLYICYC